jgi:hypothetical protein
LAWEKESKEGNAFRDFERGAGGRGRRTTSRRGTAATASKRRGGKGRGKGKTGGEDPYPKVSRIDPLGTARKLPIRKKKSDSY